MDSNSWICSRLGSTGFLLSLKNKFSVSIGFNWVSSGLIGFYEALSGFVKFYSILMGFHGFFIDFINLNRFYWFLSGSIELLPSFT